MKHLHYITMFLIAAALMSCGGGNSFKIDGELVHVDGAAVRVVFNSDSGIVDQWVDVDKKGHFTFKGEASQLTIVNLLDHSDKLIANMVAVNGDHLKVKGDASVAMSVKVKGNKVNEDWQLFRNEHAAFYTDPNPSRLNAAIEKYVRENATDVLSTALLVADYSDYSDIEKVKNLFNGIDLLAKPESLTAGMNLKGRKTSSLPRLMTLTLVKHGGTFEEIKLTGKYSLINMWVNPQQSRETMIGKLQDLDKGVQVIDVLAEGDTLHWHQTIGNDPAQWKHYWAPGGPIEQGIQLLGVTSMPWYAVTDSTGLVVYSGTSLSSALKAIAH
jgi:hypothetical protein